jgi:uncharacterized protein (UPF0335 family)
MTKPLKFDASAPAGEEAHKIANAGDVKKFIERAQSIEQIISDAKEDLGELYKEAEDAGIDKKALKFVVRHKKSPISVEHRQAVNEVMEKAGEQKFFAFV